MNTAGQFPHQLIEADPAATLEFALEAFKDARLEIMRRLEYRANLINMYLVGSVTLFGVIVAIMSGNVAFAPGRVPLELCLVPSLFGLIISMQLRSYISTIENLAEYIRQDLNPVLMKLGAWAPYWDFSTRSTTHPEWSGRTTVSTYEQLKTRARLQADAVSIHAPTLLSFLFFFSYDPSSGDSSLYRVFLLEASAIMLVLAIASTISGYHQRAITAGNPILYPTWWRELIAEKPIAHEPVGRGSPRHPQPPK